MSKLKTVYLAGPLFSQAEQAWCRRVRDALHAEAGVEVNWPGDTVGKLSLMGMSPQDTQKAIAEACKKGVRDCDILVLLLDTIPTDDGTAFELGYLIGHLGARRNTASGTPVVGLRTDQIRNYGDSGAVLNSMIGAHVNRMCSSIGELVRVIRVVRGQFDS